MLKSKYQFLDKNSVIIICFYRKKLSKIYFRTKIVRFLSRYLFCYPILGALIVFKYTKEIKNRIIVGENKKA